VKQRGGGDEAESIAECAVRGGHLGAVGEAVENRKQADECHAGGDGQTSRCRDQDAKHEDGGGDALFDAGEIYAGAAERSADGQRDDESGWHKPAGATAKLRGPEADGDHREQVIPAGEWVGEAGVEIPSEFAAVVARVGEGGKRRGNGSKNEGGAAEGFHGGVSSSLRAKGTEGEAKAFRDLSVRSVARF